MTDYLLAAAVIFIDNLMPAFAPPTWSLLVYFELARDLNPVALIAIGIFSAAAGRFILAHTFRRLRRFLPAGYVRNLENLGSQLTAHRGKAAATFGLFFFSPLSSAQLFEAAGLMRSLNLARITVAFMCGRLVTYTFYVYGTHTVAETDLGKIVTDNMSSPASIAIQIATVLAVGSIGLIKWRHADDIAETGAPRG